MDLWRLEQRLAPQVRRLSLASDSTLFLRGDATWAMFGVLDGQLRLSRSTADGGLLTLHVAQRGSFLAEASLYATEYHCDCTAMGPATVVAFPKDPMRVLLRTDPSLAEAFCQMQARQIQQLRAQVELRNIRRATDRLFVALSLSAPASGGSFVATDTWKAFATQIGLTHEALYRALRQLEGDGRLRRDGTRVEIVVSAFTAPPR